MRVLVSTASLGATRGQAEAVERLRAADLLPIALGPLEGPILGEAPGVELAIGAFLPPGPSRPNLCAGDDDLRRASVGRYKDAIARAAELGIPAFALSPGWALEQSASLAGELVGAPIGRARAESQLERSLDALAEFAQGRGIRLSILNQGPSGRPVLTLPAEIARVLAIVAAPDLGLLLDGPRFEAACRPEGLDPEVGAAALLGLVVGVQVDAALAARGWIRSLLAAGGQQNPDLPLVLAVRDREVGFLSTERARLEEVLHAPA